jgi:5-(carboxyamino)imidazole ribonucleotide synthase
MKTPRPRIGILGAGQLALMLAEAARNLDRNIEIDIVCAGRTGDCASQVAPVVAVDLESAPQVRAFHDTVDFLTIESENIDASVLQNLSRLTPNVEAIRIAQDRLLEKDFLRVQGIATAPYAAVSSLRDLHAALDSIGAPSILKTRRLGYDGRGQVRLTHTDEAASAWAHTGGAPCILEGMVPFDLEVSLIAARNARGEIVFYPLTRNIHREGILRTSIAPFENPALQSLAESHMRSLLEALDYIGVLAIEFFVTGDTLIANEIAPRVHNSGHWTIEGSDTSQFENCLRAMLGIELGSTASRPTVMLNCIGTMPPLSETEKFPKLFRHDYGKQARPGRKVGHLTFPATESATIEEWQHRLSRTA